MVSLIPWNKLYKYEALERIDSTEGRKYVYGDQRLPSVTTILSATGDKSSLEAWAARVGPENAENIKNEASTIGTHMHTVMERLLAHKDLPRPTNWLMTQGYEMGYRLVNQYFKHLECVFGSEVPLFYPEKYAGTADLVGVYRGRQAIIDFKQSNKPKKKEWIQNYFHQLAAYAMAHDQVHGTSIDYGVILMAVRDGTTAEFTTVGHEFKSYKETWMRRVEQYYAGIGG